MRRVKRFTCVVLALLLVFSLGFSVAPAHALVMDPVGFLFPIWYAYGQQAGVTISTIGGNDFTQDSFPDLFNEWQQAEVSAGNQSSAQTLSGFVAVLRDLISIGAGSTSANNLWSQLRIASAGSDLLARFWNWIIKDKLGGTTVNSINFSQTAGNLGQAVGVWNGQPVPKSSDLSWANILSNGKQIATEWYAMSETGVDVYVCWMDIPSASNGGYLLMVSPDYDALIRSAYTGRDFTRDDRCRNNSSYDLYYLYYSTTYNPSGATSFVPSFDNITSALSSISAQIDNPSSAGSLSVAPKTGVEALGFPDTTAQDYTPAAENIDLSIPYDPTADLDDLLTDAYPMALEGTLTAGIPLDISVPGTGTVEGVGAYVVPGLDEVFPFCIPFDIYHFLSALAADPQAPSFQATLALPEAIGGDQVIELDFDTALFNQLASLLRLLELLAFIVGLAFVTRSFFIRG